MATHSSFLAWRIPMDKGARRATVHRVTELDITKATYHHTGNNDLLKANIYNMKLKYL